MSAGTASVAVIAVTPSGDQEEKGRIDLFLSHFFGFSAFWGSSGFGLLNRFFLVFLATNMSEPRFYYTHGATGLYLCTHYLIKGIALCRVLLYLVRNSSNKQHQSKRVFTMERISAGAVTADITNKNA